VSPSDDSSPLISGAIFPEENAHLAPTHSHRTNPCGIFLYEPEEGKQNSECRARMIRCIQKQNRQRSTSPGRSVCIPSSRIDQCKSYQILNMRPKGKRQLGRILHGRMLIWTWKPEIGRPTMTHCSAHPIGQRSPLPSSRVTRDEATARCRSSEGFGYSFYKRLLSLPKHVLEY